MATSTQKERTWIALNPAEGIHLKGMVDGEHFILVVDGLIPTHALYQKARTNLGFFPVHGTNLLARRIPRNMVKASIFHPVWPGAHLAKMSEMKKEDYLLTADQKELVKASMLTATETQKKVSSENTHTPIAEKPAAKDRLYANWIDLQDEDGVMLKAGKYNDRLTLVLEGITPGSQLFHRVIEELRFMPSREGVYLIKTHRKGDLVYPHQFHSIWPKARLSRMLKSDYSINFAERAKRLDQSQSNEAKQSREQAKESLHSALTHARYLGRNLHGHRVYEGVVGRFFVTNEDAVTMEDEMDSRPMFLRSNTLSEVRECAKGLLRGCEQGEPYRVEQLIQFAATVLGKDIQDVTAEDRELIARAIDSAILESLQDEMQTVGQVSADAAYFQEMMPGRAQFCEDSDSAPFLPAPIAVQIQRYLESFDTVHVSGRIPGIGFGLLPDSTQVFVQDPDTLQWGNESYHRPSIQPFENMQFAPKAGYLRVSNETSESEMQSFFSGLAQGATAIVTAGSHDIAALLQNHAHIVQAIKVPAFLATTNKPVFMYVLKKDELSTAREDGASAVPALSTVMSWDDLKTLGDETLIRLGQEEVAAVTDATSTKPRQNRSDNRFQRPYISFSRTGQSSTMVPKNLQSALSFALSRLDSIYGSIDQFVSDELGMSIPALARRVSPEQIDAISLIIHRALSGRGFILGDETGIGKGRIIASTATWVNKQDRKIIFITDRANLFSDFARDLIDIGEWERFRPLITNSDGKIMNIMGNAETLAEALTPAQFADVMQNGHNANIIFTTYSQINQTDSAKAAWLIEEAKDAYVIMDESHIGAGSDSNTTQNLEQVLDNAWGVLYSSATWAKSAKNLRIYSRALPESVNVSQVSTAMEEEGESFSEIFCSMLAMDGAFIRREHDLSKIDFVLDTADKYAQRNIEITDKVAEVLGMMAMLSGDINSMLQRMNSETRNALIAARGAHADIRQADMTNTAHLLNQRKALEQELEENQALLLSLLQEQQANPTHEPEQYSIEERIVDTRAVIASIERNLEELPKPSSSATSKPRMFSSSFGTGGAIYQVMRRTQAALLADHVGDRVLEGLERGQRPVVVFAETGENFVRQFIEQEHERIRDEVKKIQARELEGEDLDAETLAQTREIAALLDAGAKSTDVVKQIRVPAIPDMMRGLLQRLGGVRVSELTVEEAPDDGRAQPSTPTGQEGEVARNEPRLIEHLELVANDSLINLPGISEEVVKRYMDGVKAISAKIDQLPPIPVIPVDALRARLAAEDVSMGEISGRTYQLEPAQEGADFESGPARLVKRARKKSDIIQTAKRFNDGHIDVIAINEAGATGISVHASPRFGNSNQRLIIEWQPSSDSTKRAQLFGRGNRFDQVIPPEIAIESSGVPAENRSIMMNNKKFAGMSATIRSSRENAVINESVPDLLNRTGDRVVQEYLLDNPGIASRLDIAIDKITHPYGLANMVTQRLSLLESKHYLKVFDDLTAAYEDALIENELSLDSDAIRTKDWKARTVRQRRVWGPSENIERLSAFDSPVFLREVEYRKFYNPLHWEEVTGKIAASTARLLLDDRVRRERAKPILNHTFGDFVSQRTLRNEESMTADARRQMWLSGIIESMARFLPEDAVTGNQDVDDFARFGSNSDEDQGTLFEQPRIKPLGFKALAGHWVPVDIRIPTTQKTQCMMALVSKSGKSAKLWVPSVEGGAQQYYVNLDKAIEVFDSGDLTDAFREGAKVELLSDDSWQHKRFDSVWGSTDARITLVDFGKAIQKAGMFLEAKKITALSSTGFDDIEAALSSPNHNAVKEAHWRKMFVEKVLPTLTPGVQMLIDSKDNKRFASFLDLRRMIITDVVMPGPNEEATLSKWKFHVATPGEEKTTVLSGALLFKMAGPAPFFSQLWGRGNLFSGASTQDKNFIQRQFDKHKKEELLITKNLLVGNAFQAGEWARNTKRGTPILYTDHNGNPHRAIEISNNARDAAIDGATFPLQLRQPKMINNFIDRIFDAYAQDGTSLNNQSEYGLNGKGFLVYSSFAGTMSYQQETRRQYDQVLISPDGNAIALLLDKSEKERFRRSLRSAVNAEKKRWAAEHPGEEDPLVYKTAAARSAKEFKQFALTIELPVDAGARRRLINELVKSQGLSLFVSRHGPSRHAYSFAEEVESAYFQESINLADEQQRLREEGEKRRLERRKMLENAINPLEHKKQPSQPSLGIDNSTEAERDDEADESELTGTVAGIAQAEHEAQNELNCSPSNS